MLYVDQVILGYITSQEAPSALARTISANLLTHGSVIFLLFTVSSMRPSMYSNSRAVLKARHVYAVSKLPNLAASKSSTETNIVPVAYFDVHMTCSPFECWIAYVRTISNSP